MLSYSRNSPHFMGPEGSFPHSQLPATCPLSWASSIQSVPPHPTFNPLNAQLNPICHLLAFLRAHHFLHVSRIRVNIILPSTPGSPKCSPSPQVSPTKTLYTPLLSPIRATCPSHLILLDFITRTILGEEYRSLSTVHQSTQHNIAKRVNLP